MTDYKAMKEEFWAYVRKLTIGKRVGGSVYLHKSVLDGDEKILEYTSSYRRQANFNLVKLNMVQKRVSLLLYPDFLREAFPKLAHSITWTNGEKKTRFYKKNPPILHRKELFISKEHPLFGVFSETTRVAESEGLFQNPSLIGRVNHWEALLLEKGLRVEGNLLLKMTAEE